MPIELGEPNLSSVTHSLFVFELYLNEEEGRHQEIRENLIALFEEHLPGNYQLETVNVAQQPERAAQSSVLATPTLIKRHPIPAQRVVGDLFIGESLLHELQLFIH